LRFGGMLCCISAHVTRHADPSATFCSASWRKAAAAAGFWAEGCSPRWMAASMWALVHCLPHSAGQPVVAYCRSRSKAGWWLVVLSGHIRPLNGGYLRCWLVRLSGSASDVLRCGEFVGGALVAVCVGGGGSGSGSCRVCWIVVDDGWCWFVARFWHVGDRVVGVCCWFLGVLQAVDEVSSGSCIGNAGSRLEMCIQFCVVVGSASFVAPGWSSVMACSVASGDRVRGSCARWQVASVHRPQKSRRQHVSLGTPVALMSAVMFWPPARSTWVSGVPGGEFVVV